MKTKDEVLKQLDEIEYSLLDKEKFMPYDYSMLILWGIVSVVLFLFSGYIFSKSVYYGSVFLTVTIGGAFLVEYLLTKKENRKYRLEALTNLQKFSESVFAFNIALGILFSILLTQYHLISFIYLIWVFLIGVAEYVLGFSINSKLFFKHGKLSVVSSLAFFAINLFYDLGALNQIFAVVMVGFWYIFMGLKLKGESQSV